jgi:hypothetical protein
MCGILHLSCTSRSLPNDHLSFIFFEHTSQYFSTMVTPSPTSKQASRVARLPHVEQYFSFLSLGPCTKGFSEIRDFIIYSFQTPDECNYQRCRDDSCSNNQKSGIIASHRFLASSES